MANQLYALLVGIDRYANPAQAPHLRGCVADVEGTYGFLTYQLGVPQDNIRLLTARMDANEAPQNLATRENIIRGWREHLAQAGAGDQVFFNYSGHGARARAADSDDPSGYNETMVPHDSRTPGIYDIIDKELATLIEEVERRSPGYPLP
ncbi:MAG: caspase family protein [Caldilineaceae bacterium]